MHRSRILLVSEDSVLRDEMARGLELEHFEVYRAIERLDALPLMYQVHPDAILLDIAAHPEVAWETLESIRAFATIPVLLISNPITQMDRLRGRQLGVIIYLDHLSPLPNLLSQVCEVLERPVSEGTRGRKAGASQRRPRRERLDLQFLTWPQVADVDRALAERDVQEVWLIRDATRLRFITKVKSHELIPQHP